MIKLLQYTPTEQNNDRSDWAGRYNLSPRV